MVVERIHTLADATLVADRVMEMLATPLLLGEPPDQAMIVVRGSLGIALSDAADDEVERLLRVAERAMRAAKAAGGERYHATEAAVPAVRPGT